MEKYREARTNADGSITLIEDDRELAIPAGTSAEDFETQRAGFFTQD